MLSVLICEDDNDYRKKLSECIVNYIMMENLDVELALSTAAPKDIIQHIQYKNVNGIYFLDIEINEHNGVELAEEIRKYDPRGFIVFVTSHKKYLGLTFKYKVEALAYIEKDHTEKVYSQVCECILYANKKYISRSNMGCFLFKTQDNRHISFDYEDILFFQSDPKDSRRIIVYTNVRPYTFYGTLNQVSKELNHDFFRCHKSYIVNIKGIKEFRIGEEKLLMKNNEFCMVSSRNKGRMNKLLNLYQ